MFCFKDFAAANVNKKQWVSLNIVVTKAKSKPKALLNINASFL